MKTILYYICLVVTVVLPSGLPAYPSIRTAPVVLDSVERDYSINRNLDILEDKTGNLTFEEASSPALSEQYIPAARFIPQYKLKIFSYWVRFRVTFPDKINQENQNWFIKCGWPDIVSVTAYIPGPGNRYRKSESGISHPIDSREVPDKFPIFKMSGLPGDTVTVYMNIQSHADVIMSLSIIPEKINYREMTRENLFTGAFFGIMIIMIFYHLLLYAAVRDRDYLYFVCFIIAQVIFQLASEGTLTHTMPMRSDGAVSGSIALFVTAAIFLNAIFFKHILNLKKGFPSAAKLIKSDTAAICNYGICQFYYSAGHVLAVVLYYFIVFNNYMVMYCGDPSYAKRRYCHISCHHHDF